MLLMDKINLLPSFTINAWLQATSKVITIHKKSKKTSSHSDSNITSKLTESYVTLQRSGESCYAALTLLGETVQLASPAAKKEMGDDGMPLPPHYRIRWHTRGCDLWNALRTCSSAFRDGGSNASSANAARKTGNTDDHRAGAAGFLRFIAARMVLLDHVVTSARKEGEDGDASPWLLPSLLPSGDNVGTASSSSLNAAISIEELEFGLRCWTRAGRTLLQYATSDISKQTPNNTIMAATTAAYESLHLMRSCWNKLEKMGGGDYETMNQIVDEAFEGLMLLPDASFIIFKIYGDSSNNNSGCDKSSASHDATRHKHQKLQRHPVNGRHPALKAEHVVKLLQDVDGFITRRLDGEKEEDESSQGSEGDRYHLEGRRGKISSSKGVSGRAFHKFLPTLTRESYKVSVIEIGGCAHFQCR